MPLLPFPPYQPDIVDYQGNSSITISGVVPRGDGYGPVPAPVVYSAALPDTCRGAFVAWRDDGTVRIFAATATRLYLLDNSTLAWGNVTNGGDTANYPPLTNDAQWQFAQFGNTVIAVQANTVPQAYNLLGTGDFANLGGTPPAASYVSIVGRFVVLSGMVGATAADSPYTVRWSGLNAPTTWTPGTNSSDYQQLPDGGVVRGVAGGESGIILQDSAIRKMTFTQETTLVFQIERVSQDKGLYGPYSLTRAGEVVFFISPQGLNRFAPGELPIEIGKAKFDRTLMNDIDRANLQLAIGAADPRQTRLLLAYKSLSGAAGLYDKMLCYDYLLDKASLIPISGEYLFNMAQPGITLESLNALAPGIITISAAAAGTASRIRLTVSGLSAGTPPFNNDLNVLPSVDIWGVTGGVPSGTFFFTIIDATHIELTGTTFTTTGTGKIGGSLDQMTASLDTYAEAVTPELAHFDTSHRLCFFRGAPMEATIDTAEQGTDGRRLRVRGFRPITDAGVAFGSLVSRETVQATPTITTETVINAIGMCPQNKSARYARGRLRIPAGTPWTYAVGVEPDFTLEGLK